MPAPRTPQIIGAVDETVELAFAKPGSAVVSTTICKIGPAGTATATYDGEKATC